MTRNSVATRIQRMPTHFGTTVSPRQRPDGGAWDHSDFRTTSYRAAFESDPSQLEKLIEPPLELDGTTVSVEFAYYENIAWLAGRGYDVLGVEIPVRFNGEIDDVAGSLMLVLWENMAEPIMTGREELGIPKIFCEIPPPRQVDDQVICEASWCGHLFARMCFQRDGTDPPSAEPRELLAHKYFPSTQWGEADASYITGSGTGPDGPGNGMESLEAVGGKATIEFFPTEWEQMPTQHSIVEGLRSLKQRTVLPGGMSRLRGWDSFANARVLR